MWLIFGKISKVYDAISLQNIEIKDVLIGVENLDISKDSTMKFLKLGKIIVGAIQAPKLDYPLGKGKLLSLTSPTLKGIDITSLLDQKEVDKSKTFQKKKPDQSVITSKQAHNKVLAIDQVRIPAITFDSIKLTDTITEKTIFEYTTPSAILNVRLADFVSKKTTTYGKSGKTEATNEGAVALSMVSLAAYEGKNVSIEEEENMRLHHHINISFDLEKNQLIVKIPQLTLANLNWEGVTKNNDEVKISTINTAQPVVQLNDLALTLTIDGNKEASPTTTVLALEQFRLGELKAGNLEITKNGKTQLIEGGISLKDIYVQDIAATLFSKPVGAEKGPSPKVDFGSNFFAEMNSLNVQDIDLALKKGMMRFQYFTSETLTINKIVGQDGLAFDWKNLDSYIIKEGTKKTKEGEVIPTKAHIKLATHLKGIYANGEVLIPQLTLPYIEFYEESSWNHIMSNGKSPVTLRNIKIKTIPDPENENKRKLDSIIIGSITAQGLEVDLGDQLSIKFPENAFATIYNIELHNFRKGLGPDISTKSLTIQGIEVSAGDLLINSPKLQVESISMSKTAEGMTLEVIKPSAKILNDILIGADGKRRALPLEPTLFAADRVKIHIGQDKTQTITLVNPTLPPALLTATLPSSAIRPEIAANELQLGGKIEGELKLYKDKQNNTTIIETIGPGASIVVKKGTLWIRDTKPENEWTDEERLKKEEKDKDKLDKKAKAQKKRFASYAGNKRPKDLEFLDFFTGTITVQYQKLDWDFEFDGMNPELNRTYLSEEITINITDGRINLQEVVSQVTQLQRALMKNLIGAGVGFTDWVIDPADFREKDYTYFDEKNQEKTRKAYVIEKEEGEDTPLIFDPKSIEEKDILYREKSEIDIIYNKDSSISVKLSALLATLIEKSDIKKARIEQGFELESELTGEQRLYLAYAVLLIKDSDLPEYLINQLRKLDPKIFMKGKLDFEAMKQKGVTLVQGLIADNMEEISINIENQFGPNDPRTLNVQPKITFQNLKLTNFSNSSSNENKREDNKNGISITAEDIVVEKAIASSQGTKGKKIDLTNIKITHFKLTMPSKTSKE